jgi:hypothetical protein
VRPLDLLHVEPHRVDAVLPVEVEEFVRVVQRVGGQYGDDVEGDAVLVQQLDAGQDAVERSPALARAAVPVVQERRPVHADADVDLVAVEVRAPVGAEERGVRLEGLAHGHAAGIMLVQQRGRRFVEGDRQDERFARVPQERERLACESAGEDPAEGPVEDRGGGAARGLPVGQVAVRAVEVAEGRRL